MVCPHCRDLIVVARRDIKCAIFRHAVFRETLEPIPPHATREECEALVGEERVWGCAGPFRLIQDNQGSWEAKACGYI